MSYAGLGQVPGGYGWYYAVATVPWRGLPAGFIGWLYTDLETAKFVANEANVFSMIPMGDVGGWAWHPVMAGPHSNVFRGWTYTSEWPATALTTGWGIQVFDAQGNKVGGP